jgi:hypothetical protein
MFYFLRWGSHIYRPLGWYLKSAKAQKLLFRYATISSEFENVNARLFLAFAFITGFC